ncbi:methyltransferase [Geodermatophilus obscurus]|uniref:Methylase of polypeptide chain release factors-like protein n=1 Tax=Geodermatophilus obscurus (strain ATCC 25078 / DSM 43160 / JCM 3152 / CCUG 61914 / KCC A-0152 / KCTC 9177 / NBRC 13315 / NRRL B-3577 / G-20) TaxID=526225 RepID=D2S8N8_GEOOG|nr:methyltransferase [Geodermatophilus obscurus]ADB75619.1 Methylase of polypeptide chain release factors-like protein [Geodermatophilus obscurus DSM 43160]
MSCFSSADESAHYGFSVCMLLQHYREQLGWAREGVVELGTGDATAIADVVAGLPELRVRSFDISAPSVERARENIAARGVADRYTVEFGDFFDRADSAAGPSASTVIANPPYIPAPDRDIRMPELWGGVYGNDLVLQLLKAGYRNVVTAVPSYADPETTVRTAEDLGYRVVNFLAMCLDYGEYSSEQKVRDHVRRLVAEGRGWAGEDEYMVAVALFTQDADIPGDRGAQLLRALQIAV